MAGITLLIFLLTMAFAYPEHVEEIIRPTDIATIKKLQEKKLIYPQGRGDWEVTPQGSAKVEIIRSYPSYKFQGLRLRACELDTVSSKRAKVVTKKYHDVLEIIPSLKKRCQ